MSFECPVKAAPPWRTSHTRRVLSQLAETAVLPSGVSATAWTRSSCALRGSSRAFPCGDVPHAEGLVVTGGDGRVAVGRERHGIDPLLSVLRGSSRAFPRGDVPHAERVMSALPETAVWPSSVSATALTHCVCPLRVLKQLPRGDVPRSESVVETAGDGRVAIGRERHGGDIDSCVL